jgi:hypothetical protein
VTGLPGARDVALTGWIGDHPADGSDVAHLLLYPVGPGIAEGMEMLAETLSLVRSDGPRMVEVLPEVASMRVVGAHASLVIGDEALLVFPVRAGWRRAAEAHRLVVLSLGLDPLDGVSMPALDRYTAHCDRVWVGLLTT